MNCIWRGTINSVFWPRHSQPSHNLPSESWCEDHCKFDTALDGQQLVFAEYVPSRNVPLYQICGPEVRLFAKDAGTQAYFQEFACLDKIAMKVKINSCFGDLDFDHISVFLVTEGDETYIGARPSNSKLTIEQIPPKVSLREPVKTSEIDLVTKPKESIEQKPDQSEAQKPKPHSEPPNPSIWKKTVQQTISAGMRLHGIRSHDKKFKKSYFGVFNLVEIAIESTEPSKVTVAYIQEKVEGLSSMVE